MAVSRVVEKLNLSMNESSSSSVTKVNLEAISAPKALISRVVAGFCSNRADCLRYSMFAL